MVFDKYSQTEESTAFDGAGSRLGGSCPPLRTTGPSPAMVRAQLIEDRVSARPRPARQKPQPRGGSVEADCRCWSREDKGAKVYRTTLNGGPRWEYVVRRVVLDTRTGEVLDDRGVREVTDEGILYGPIPGAPRDVTTRLYHNDPEVGGEASASE